MELPPLLALSAFVVLHLPALPVQAQDPGYTIVAAPPQPLISGMINPLATLTITETEPAAFGDGYFRLLIVQHPELQAGYFTDGSTASGAVGPEGAAPDRIELLVQVDADDLAIDSITVDASAFFQRGIAGTAPGIDVRILDGETGSLPGEFGGDLSGIWSPGNFLSYRLGVASNLHYLAMLAEDVPDVSVGETVSVALGSGFPAFEGPLTVNVLTPTTISAEIVDNQLMITGLSEGAADLELLARIRTTASTARYWYDSASFEVIAAQVEPPRPPWGHKPPFHGDKPPFPGHKPPFFGDKFPPRGVPFSKGPPWDLQASPE